MRARRFSAPRALILAWLEGLLPWWLLAGAASIAVVVTPLSCTDPLYLEEAVILGVGFDFGEQEDRNAAPAIARCVLALGPGAFGGRSPRVSFRRDVAEVCAVPGEPPAAGCLTDGLIVLPVSDVFPGSLLCHEANHARLGAIGGLGNVDYKHLDPSWPAADGATTPRVGCP